MIQWGESSCGRLCKKKIFPHEKFPHRRGKPHKQDIVEGRSDREEYERASLLGLPHEFLKGTLRTNSRTRSLRHFPVVLILQESRVKGPQRAWTRFDRVDSTLHLRIIEKAEPVCFAGDIDFPMLFKTTGCEENVRRETQESGDFFNLAALDSYPAFTVTAGPTSFTFEGFQ